MHWIQLALVLGLSFAACALSALSQQRHWRAARGIAEGTPGAALRRGYRALALVGAGAGLWVAVLRDGWFFGLFIWLFAVQFAGLLLVSVLTLRAGLLRPLAR